jgi:uncharacterized membrane protein YfcA
MIFLFFASLVTATISSLTGMAGGVVLLSLMTLVLPVKLIIPIHGLVQLFSNALRVYYLKKSVQLNFIKFYIIGLPLGAMLSVFFLRNVLNETWLLVMLAILISYSIFKPKKLPSLKIKNTSWSLVGLITGMLAILVGSVGPFLAAFYVRDDMDKEEIVATKATMQFLAHIIKIPSFIFIGFNYFEHITLTTIMVIGALIGTKMGVIALKKIDNKSFHYLFKIFLFIALVRIIYKLVSMY